MTLAVVSLVGGLALLLVGAEQLVGAAARLALLLGIPPLVVGLTVVAFGTSAPELAVSLRAAFDGTADLAVGNVVGSNLFNILFILGLSALVSPLAVPLQLVRVDIPVMIGVTVLTFVWSLDGSLVRGEGGLLVLGLATYLLWLARLGRAETVSAASTTTGEAPRFQLRDVFALIGGLALLTLGASLLVDGAVTIATRLGVSQVVIGVTIVAAGTSLPEIATSVLAARRGHREIAMGNIVGSNIFNILSVLGLSAALAPSGLPVAPSLLRIEFPAMLAVSVALLPVCASRSSIARWEGSFFLLGYLAFATYTLAHALEHPLVPTIDRVILLGLLPVALIGLIVDVAIHQRRRSRPVIDR